MDLYIFFPTPFWLIMSLSVHVFVSHVLFHTNIYFRISFLHSFSRAHRQLSLMYLLVSAYSSSFALFIRPPHTHSLPSFIHSLLYLFHPFLQLNGRIHFLLLITRLSVYSFAFISFTSAFFFIHSSRYTFNSLMYVLISTYSSPFISFTSHFFHFLFMYLLVSTYSFSVHLIHPSTTQPFTLIFHPFIHGLIHFILSFSSRTHSLSTSLFICFFFFFIYFVHFFISFLQASRDTFNAYSCIYSCNSFL